MDGAHRPSFWENILISGIDTSHHTGALFLKFHKTVKVWTTFKI